MPLIINKIIIIIVTSTTEWISVSWQGYHVDIVVLPLTDEVLRLRKFRFCLQRSEATEGGIITELTWTLKHSVCVVITNYLDLNDTYSYYSVSVSPKHRCSSAESLCLKFSHNFKAWLGEGFLAHSLVLAGFVVQKCPPSTISSLSCGLFHWVDYTKAACLWHRG